MKKELKTIFRSFKLLYRYNPFKLIMVFLLTLFQGISAGVSILLLLPLLQLLAPENEIASNKIAQLFQELPDKTGIPLNLETILLAYVVLLASVALINYKTSLLNTGYQQKFIYDLRRRLFRKIIMADWTELNDKSKTSHLQVLSNEVPNLANFYFFLIRLLISMIMMGVYIVFAFLISVKFTLLVTAMGILLFFLLRKYIFKAFSIGEEQVEYYRNLLKYIDDFWETIKIAKVHSSEKFYYNQFNSASSSLLDLELRMEKNYALPNLIYRLAGIIVLVLVIYLGYRFEQIPLTSFFILIVLFSRIYPRFSGINSNINIIISNLASVKLVMNLDETFLDKKIHDDKEHNSIPFQKEIVIKNLGFAYPGGNWLLRNFNETIPARKITGIVGESGRGKTSLIDIIAGLQRPVEGEIRVDAQLLKDENLPGWRQSIGYLPQDAFFIDGTLRENLVWDSNSELTDETIAEVLKRVNAKHLVDRFEKGLEHYLSNYNFHFSGGERQRLALARVLLRKPVILLLDEATSSLDSENEKQIMELLAQLKKEITILFVSHRTSVHPWFDKTIELGKV